MIQVCIYLEGLYVLYYELVTKSAGNNDCNVWFERPLGEEHAKLTKFHGIAC